MLRPTNCVGRPTWRRNCCQTEPVAGSRLVVTVTESIFIARPPEAVFDYTQDYARRTEWDAGIEAAELVSEEPRAARVTIRRLGSATVRYQLFQRPERTSAAFVDVDSIWITGGGGSWQYEATDGGTTWQQTNTLELKRPWLTRFIKRSIERSLRDSTRTSMATAKERLERGPSDRPDLD